MRFAPIAALQDAKPADFEAQINDRFPVPKEVQEVMVATSVSPNKDLKTEMKTVQKRWIYFSRDESKAVTVAGNEFTLEYKKYCDIQATRDDFVFLWKAFQKVHQVETLDRIGLRYINEIALPSGDPLAWDGWINEKIIGATLGVAAPAAHNLARSMHRIFWVADDHRVVFQFGIHNSDFPNPVAKREFVLDYDCFSTVPTDAPEAEKYLLQFNDLIDDLFEKSIAEQLRQQMGVNEADARL